MVTISSPVLATLQSNDGSNPTIYNLKIRPNTRINATFIFANPTMNTTIQLYKAGSKYGEPITLIVPATIQLQNADYSSISIFDSANTYTIYVITSTEIFNSETEALQFPANLSLSVINTQEVSVLGNINSTIISPLDANGNVKVNAESVAQLPVALSASGNLKSALEEYLNGTLHKNLATVVNASIAASGNILSSAVTAPFDGTIEIDIIVSAATTISAIINGTSTTLYTFSAAGYASIELELPSGATLQLTSSAAATITATVGAKV